MFDLFNLLSRNIVLVLIYASDLCIFGLDDSVSCIFLVRWCITCQGETFEEQHIDEMGSNLAAPSEPHQSPPS